MWFMGNPFYLQEVPVEAPLCDRESELKEVQYYAEAKANVVIFSPRRFGKTSLVRRVQGRLADKGAVVILADLFGVGSVEDMAARLAKAVYGFSHGKAAFWKTALRTLLSFRPVLKPDPSGGISLSVEPAKKILAGGYIQRHGLGSTGGVQHSARQLEDLDLIERRGDQELWQLVDPILTMWLGASA